MNSSEVINSSEITSVPETIHCLHCRETEKLFLICICGEQFCKSNGCQQIYINKHLDSCTEGRVGLKNIGNTCYLNSCLQCLSHTVPFREYFKSKIWEQDVKFLETENCDLEKNDDSEERLFKKAARRLFEVLRSLWDKNEEAPLALLKKDLVDVKKKYQKSTQEDANEIFIDILDIFDQGLNRVKKNKNIAMRPLKNSDPLEYKWLSHLSSLQSITTDLFTGLAEQKIRCKECNKISVSFETFSFVYLEIPHNVELLEVHIIYCEFGKRDESVLIKCSNPNGESIKREIIQQIGGEMEEFVLFVLSKNGSIEKISPDTTLKLNQSGNNIYLIQYSMEEMEIFTKFAMTTSFFHHQKPIWFKRPFFIDLQNETWLGIKRKILKFLYEKAYQNKKKRRLTETRGESYEQFERKMLNSKQSLIFKLSQIKKRFVHNSYKIKYGEEVKMEDKSSIYKSMIEKDLKEEEPENVILQFEIVVNFDEVKDQFQFEEDQDESENQNDDEQKEKSLTVTLEECFETYMNEETLGTDSEPVWECSACETTRVALKTCHLYQLPEILVVTLNRFQNNNSEEPTKDNTPVIFPLTLNMKKYAESPYPMSAFKQSLKRESIYIHPKFEFKVSEKKTFYYELYAFIIHEGNLTKGHYIAFAKVGDGWWKYNDKEVSSVKIEEIQQPNVYVLFYQRH